MSLRMTVLPVVVKAEEAGLARTLRKARSMLANEARMVVKVRDFQKASERVVASDRQPGLILLEF